MSTIGNPTLRTLDRRFLSFDLEKIRASFDEFVKSPASFFSRPADAVTYRIITDQGAQEGEFEPSQLQSLVDKIDSDTKVLSFQIFPDERLANFGARLPPDEYINWSLNLNDRKLIVTLRIAQQEMANLACRILTKGVRLVAFALPASMSYLSTYLENLFHDYPNYERNIFLMMRFTEHPTHAKITSTLITCAADYGMAVLRADNRLYSDDLWDNVLTYIYGCMYGIAVFDQINVRDFNPNVALEVGFMLAQEKKLLLLKDKGIHALPTDLVGRVYRPFDTYDPENTIPLLFEKWMSDLRIEKPLA